ncbi:uncharacterized protein [Halyomorpha halys]|uniref:uncharacterized protein n=1 Tax=Halyomorpha halys TaxID=286706 RepID=UPI0006D4FAE6|nr:uncharacterized protein LOC106689051 [Halyomorpha halys]
MDRTRILPIAVVIVILAVTVTISADDVKHKRVIVKVPKKINHVHHHHVKKVHVYKHKPKPIHSIHVVEEEEPIGKEWQHLFRAQHKHSKHSPHKGLLNDGWKYDIEEEEEELGFGDEDDEDDGEEEFHKSGSHNEPTVWRSQKKGEKWNDYRGGNKRGRTTGRTSWKEDRPKRQHRNTAFHYSHEPYSRRPYSQRRPKKSSRTSKSKKSKKSKSRRPIEKGYADYIEYNDEGPSNDAPLWPERKEHISWHMRENPWSQVAAVPQVTESPNFVIEDYRTEHKGEINLSKPEIQVVQAPQLGHKQVIQEPQLWTTQEIPEHMWAKQIVTQSPYLWTNQEFQEHNLWPKEAVQQTWSQDIVQEPQQIWTNPVTQEQDWKKPETQELEKKKPFTQALKNTVIKKVTERLTTKKPIVKDQTPVLNTRLQGFRTEIKHSGTGYTSHVGHTADGDAASFQSVRFGDKIKNR